MLEKLTLNNMETLKKLYFSSLKKQSYDKDFFKCYDNENFIMKFLYRKFIKIIKLDNNYIGYMWYEASIENIVRVWALYIDSEYIGLISKEILSSFNNNILSYEAIDKRENAVILERLGFRKENYTLLMEMDIEKYDNSEKINSIYLKVINSIYTKSDIYSNICFCARKLIAGTDESLRCRIQNNIFGELNRRPLTVEDIYSDMVQDYYLKDLCIFGMINNSYIGYGQVIFSREMFTIVNFGIVREFRGLGLSKLLLHDVILHAKRAGIKKVALRVDSNNIKAINLYKWIGFKEKYKIVVWERS